MRHDTISRRTSPPAHGQGLTPAMLLSTFARLLARGGQDRPRPGQIRQFRDAVEGTAAGALSPGEFGRLARGEKRPGGRGAARKAKAFLEHGGPLPRGLRGKRRRTAPANAPKWPARELNEGERAALVGPGLKRGGRHQLLESACQAGATVGGESILRNVRVLGADSLNNRKYTRKAMEQGLPLWERAPVFLDHPDKPSAPRSLKDKIGRLVNVRLDDEGVVADLVLNAAHPMTPTVLWWFEHDPSGCGLSHNAIGGGHTDSAGTFVVDRIEKVRSVDLVSSPASVRGLV